jgi:hypothetical protein
VRVHSFGADELPSAGGSALRVKFYYARLHRHPSRPGTHAAPVPAPRAPILQRQRRCRAPAPRVEPAASLPGSEVPVRIAAGPTYGPLDLADEAGRAATGCAYPVPGFLPAAAIPNLAGTDTKVRLRCAPSDDDWKSKRPIARAEVQSA